MGYYEEEVDQPVQADYKVWVQFRTVEQAEEESVCVNSYNRRAVYDFELFCGRCREVYHG